MSWNVPDDWNSYYYSCGCHASEGGCSCKEGQLENAERPWLNESGYDLDEGSWEKLIFVKTHTCRRDHKDGKVKAGQTYRRCTYRIIDDETGESWHKHTKRVVK
ncbi:MAG: hypothetical protein CBE07_001280 [Pelagibacteraceae bacterium TMED247]|jgi:hypothetical protein|nr:MAG: hypothetical protein CBE07_001280 [Pelagibacteraceae bacterium TMED247]|tara:strand:+ start:612 stop:923 length:312 start_codon:yes stop_codon:yes gene_type:complete